VHELSRRLAGRFDVTVLAPGYPGAARNEVIDGVNVARFRYFLRSHERLAGSGGMLPMVCANPLWWLVVPFFLAGQMWSAYANVWKRRPDVIHTHWILPQGLVALSLRVLFGVPYVVTAHGGDVFGLRQSVLRPFKAIVLAFAADVTVVSQALSTEVRRSISSGVEPAVMPMGVDVGAFNPAQRDPLLRKKHGITGPFLIFVGRLAEKKGLRYLIDAMPLILKKLPFAKLLVIGDGPLEEEHKRQAASLGLGKRVLFLGSLPQKELPRYYASADIFIGPSVQAPDGDAEGFGLVFAEALSAGACVVATDTPAVADIITDKVTGIVVPQRDSKAIARAVLYLLRSPKVRQRLAAQGRERVNALFSWEKVAAGYATTIREAAR
jgi:glycosyltransferase involved in cell wall biosynthesis